MFTLVKNIIGYCVGMVVGNAVRSVTPKDAGKLTKVGMQIGSGALALWVGREVSQAIDNEVQEFKNLMNDEEEE